MENQTTIKVHPRSPIAQYMIESAKRKRIIREYIKAGKPLKELREKGFEFAKPF